MTLVKKMLLNKTPADVDKAYDAPPFWYDIRGFFILTFSYNCTLMAQLRFFGANFGKDHLEVACGTGTLLKMVLNWRRWHGLRESKIVGVDYAVRMLNGAKKRFAKNHNVILERADAAALPFPSDSFDTANIANSVHCFPAMQEALAEVYRVLKPGGVVALNVLLHPRGAWPLRKIAAYINGWGIRKGILHRPYSLSEVSSALSSKGFLIKSMAIHGNCLDVLCVKPPE